MIENHHRILADIGVFAVDQDESIQRGSRKIGNEVIGKRDGGKFVKARPRVSAQLVYFREVHTRPIEREADEPIAAGHDAFLELGPHPALAGPVDMPDKTTGEGLFDKPYAIAHQRMEHVATRMGVPVGFWRSVGASINTFAVEVTINELAAMAGQDALQFRRARLTDPRWLTVLDAVAGLRRGLGAGAVALSSAKALAFPLAVVAFAWWAAPRQLPLLVQSLLTLAIVTPLGPLLYRLAYEKLADATVLVLLIVSVGAHFALTGLALVFFGAEGFRNPSFWDARFAAGPLMLSGQTLIIFMVSIALIVALSASNNFMTASNPVMSMITTLAWWCWIDSSSASMRWALRVDSMCPTSGSTSTRL